MDPGQSKSHTRKTLDRELGLGSVMAVSMGAMLGSGIFVLPGLAVAKAGPALALAYLISGLIVLPAALAKCELATALPHSGGTYLYVERGMGPLAGTVVGMGTWFSLVFKSSFALIGLGAYSAILFQLPDHLLKVMALGICGGLIALNLLGAKKSARFQIFVVAAALLGLLAFSAASVPKINMSHFDGISDVGISALLGTAGFVFVSFAGVTKIASLAEEVKDPDRNLPLGILASLGLICLIYVVISFVLVGVVPVEVIADTTNNRHLTPLSSVPGKVFGPAVAMVMAALAIMTLTSMANSGLLSSSRFPLAMSRDKLAPAFLSKISERFRTPAPAILLTGALMMLLIAFVPVRELAKLASAFKLLLFMLVNVALIVLRESGARWYKPSFRIPLYPLAPILGIVGPIVLLGYMGPLAWIGAGGIVLSGVAWYFLYAKRRVTRRGALTRLYGERRRLSGRAERPGGRSGVIVPIFLKDEGLETLIPLGAIMADAEHDDMQVLRIEEVPDQASLGDFSDEDAVTVQIEDHVRAVAEEYGFPCSFEDVLTHNAKHVLYERAILDETHWIVMRWQARSRWRVFVPDPVAWFIHHPPCNLLLYRNAPGSTAGGLDRFKKVVVLAEPGPHDTLVVHVAGRLAKRTGADLTFVYLAPFDATEEAVQGVLDYHAGLSRMVGPDVGEAEVLRAEDDLQAVLARCQEADLLILGAPPEREVRGAFRGSFEDRVTEQAPCAVIRVKAVRRSAHSSLRGKLDESQRLSPVRVKKDPSFSISSLIDHVSTSPGSLRTKTQLFHEIAQGFADRHGAELLQSVEGALWERERKQVTSMSHGVAIPHVTMDELDRTYIEVWLLDRAIDFKGGTEVEPVDVCFVMMGPPAERRTHLRSLARIGRLALHEGFLDTLRAAETAYDVRRVIAAAEDELFSEPEAK